MHTSFRFLAPAFATALICAGCASNQPAAAPAPTAATSATAATAQIAPTEAGGTVKGDLKFAQTTHGVLVTGTVSGLAPNTWHGFHVHENGSCADKGNAAGGHFNPTHQPHGNPNSGAHHVGDMMPLFADAKGVASVDFTSKTMALSGPNSVVGKAVIVHEKDDNFNAQPSGDSGGRIGCGIIH